jgi:mannose-6-phosphate isomerase-like protein (cupin superfamily)
VAAAGSVTVLRLADGDRWSQSAPPWSALSAVGWFRLSAAGYRFDRHFHDCAEYWAVIEGRARVAVGGDEFDVGPGDLVCTPAGTEHDIVAVYGSDLALFFVEEAVPAGGDGGHRHRDPATAWHEVPLR